MIEDLLLDTHTWLWWEAGAEVFPLSAKLRIGRARKADSLYVAAISLHEIAYAYRRGRLNLDGPLRLWFAQAFAGSGPQVLPITVEIVMASAALPEGFHGDYPLFWHKD